MFAPRKTDRKNSDLSSRQWIYIKNYAINESGWGQSWQRGDRCEWNQGVNCFSFDLAYGSPIDYMHCVLEGEWWNALWISGLVLHTHPIISARSWLVELMLALRFPTTPLVVFKNTEIFGKPVNSVLGSLSLYYLSSTTVHRLFCPTSITSSQIDAAEVMLRWLWAL